MNLNKLNYFKKRNENLNSDFSRKSRADREIQTLKNLLSISNDDITFQENLRDSSDLLRNKLIIDLGCGDKHLEKSLKTYNASYLGLDIEDIDLELGPIPLDDNTVDIIISLAVIEHLSNPGVFLSEILRVLRPGGVLWLSTPDINASKFDFWNDPTHVHPYNPKSIRFLLMMNGFKYIRVTPNYLSKSTIFYRESPLFFLYSRFIPFKGTSKLPVPELFKGNCQGLFAIARKE